MEITKAIGVGTAGAAVVAAAAWIVVPMGRQSPVDGPVRDAVVVCLGSDSVLRSPPASGLCPKGSMQVNLAKADLDNPDRVGDDDPLGPMKKPQEDKSDPLADIARRISELENASVFEVVDQEDRVMFSVAPERVQLYNKEKTLVAEMRATSEGGELVTRTNNHKNSAFIAAYGDRAGLRLKESNVPRLDLLRQEAGNYSFKIPLGSSLTAGIGESKAGTGAIIVSDFQGRPRALISMSDGRGAATIFNDTGNAVVSLTESANGGGVLALGDPNSNAMVKMGTNYNRYGVVMTFPPGFPYVPRSGLPGSYLLGCAGGPSCVP